jgi:hypothetical protein
METAANRARELGPKLITFLKFIFIVVFVILAGIDGDITWFKRQPGKTIGEALFAGFCAALSFAIVAGMRKAPTNQIGSLFVASLVIFTILQILFELAGFNELSEDSNTGARKFGENTKKIKKNKVVLIIGGLVVFVMLCFLVTAWDTPFPKIPGTNNYTGWAISTPRFLTEMMVIGLGSAVPTILVTKNRGGNASQVMINFTAGIFLFGVLAHPSLQYSGVYREIGLWKNAPLQNNKLN